MRLAFLILLLPILAHGQTRRVFPTISDLDQTRPSRDEPVAEVLGLTTNQPFSNGPKLYRWDSTNALPTNAIRRATATGTGRWVHDWDGDVQVFGARGDGSKFVSSHDRTNQIAEVRALESQARLSSSGGAELARSFYGQVVGQSNGVITRGESFTAASPALSGGATVGSAVGLAIEQQAVSGVTNGFAIRQAGTNDINAFMSPLCLGALGTNTPLVFGGTAAPTLSAANGSLYLRTDGTMYQMTNGVWTLR